MKFKIFILASFSINSLIAQVENKSLVHDGGDRDYIVYTPTYYDANEPLPLLLCFHGYTSNANNIMLYSRFNDLAETENFIVVYPQGLLLNGSTHWNVGGWTLASTVDDVGFVDLLLDQLEEDYNIDASRIYSTGMSNGGFMSFLLACQISERIAAIASVTGSMTPQTYDACNPERILPVLQVHGNQDGVVPYEGAIWTKSIDEVISYWNEHNKCDAEAEVYNVNDSIQSDGSTVEQFVFDNGSNCSSVIHFKVDGGGHDWPGAWGNMDINASSEVWSFLSQYNTNGLIGCLTSAADQNSNNLIEIFPNPVVETLNIKTAVGKNFSYRIFNLIGSVIKTGVLTDNKNQISITTLNAGIYYLLVGDSLHKFVKL